MVLPITGLPNEPEGPSVAINSIPGHPGDTATTEGSIRTRRSLRSHNTTVDVVPPALKDATGVDNTSEPGSDSGYEAPPTAQNKGKGRSSGNEFLLDPRDPGNFLKLASVLNIFLADSLTDAEIDKADTLIREYNIELIEVS
jgi:hypothetical protein